MTTTNIKYIKPDYKQTPVGVIPKDWEVSKIEKCTIRIGDGIHATPKYSSDGEYYFINGNNLKSGEIVFNESTKRVNEEEFNKHYRELTNRTILMSINGTIGNLAYYNNEDVVLGKSACYLNVNNEINLEYFYYQLGSYLIRKSFLKRLTGSTIKNLGLKEIRKTKLPIPPLSEQKHITFCLTTWDKGIEKLSALIEVKKQQKKGLMQGLFNGQLTVDNGRLVQAKEGGDFTKDWEEVKVKEMGKVSTGNTPSKSDKNNWGNDFPWITAEDMNEKYVFDTENKLSNIGKEIARIAPKGSLMITCIASIGKNSITAIDSGFNQQINAITVNSKHNNEFLFCLINYQTHKLIKYASPGALKILNKSTFERIKYKVPSLKEQTAIAEVLTTADKEIALLKRKLKTMQSQKKGLMQVLLTGEKRLV